MKIIQKIVFVVLLLTSGGVLAKPEPDDSLVTAISRTPEQKGFMLWLTIGGGEVSPSMLGGDFKLAYAWNDIAVNAKIGGAASFIIFSGPQNSIAEYGVYVGKLSTNDYFLGRLAAGVSYFTGYLENSNTNVSSFSSSTTNFHMLGFGLEAEAMLKYKIIGIGLTVEVIGGPKFITSGVMFNVSLGKMWY